jgi:hypothetical protein
MAEEKCTIIVPCGGRSTRFPNLRPKFLLVNPNGSLMLMDSISKINTSGCSIIVSVMKEHEEKYKIGEMLSKFFPQMNIRLCVLDKPTGSQSETAYETIKAMDVRTPFLIKDSDNRFRMDNVQEPYNYVAVERLENFGAVNASNKSYAVCDSSGLISNIEEKKVVSNTFSTGGYFFTDPKEFCRAFDELRTQVSGREIYVSMLINHMIFSHKAKFKIKQISEYDDIGTYTEWIAFKEKTKAYFIDIDGVIVKNGGEFFKPYWGETEGIPENIEVINRLHAQGSQIILTTSRKEGYRKATEAQMKKFGVKYDMLVMGLMHSSRVLVNDFSLTNPFPSAEAVSLERDSNTLDRYIK